MDWIVCILIIASMALVAADVERSERCREREYKEEQNVAKLQLEAQIKRVCDEYQQRQEKFEKEMAECRRKREEELRKCGR